MAVNKIVIKDKNGNIVAQDSFASIDQVKCYVRAGTGTQPKCTPTYEDGLLILTFEEIQGDGVASLEQVQTSTDDNGVNVWRLTTDLGDTFDLEVRNGTQGNRGNGIANISHTEQSTQDGGYNSWVITEDDGRTTIIRVKNGETGAQGDSAIWTGEGEPWSEVKNQPGTSTTAPMSQKATTDAMKSQVENANENLADLTFADESGNAVVAFRDGHVVTKNFDSSNIDVSDQIKVNARGNEHADATIEDEEGNALVILNDGHIKTKNFDSRDFVPNPKKSIYDGKIISFLGDSITTYGVPDRDNAIGTWTWAGNRCRYGDGNGLLNDVKKTYWWKLMDRLGLVLGVNESWAGSMVSNKQEEDYGDRGPNRHMASMTRIGHLGANGDPDIIIVYGGTNDADSENVEIGEFNTSDPSDYTEDEIRNNLPVADFADAYRTMIIRLQYFYPNARIICMFPNYVIDHYTISRLDEFEEAIRFYCDLFGVEYVDLRCAGVNLFNIDGLFCDKYHPNEKGMELIYRYLMRKVFNDWKDF